MSHFVRLRSLSTFAICGLPKSGIAAAVGVINIYIYIHIICDICTYIIWFLSVFLQVLWVFVVHRVLMSAPVARDGISIHRTSTCLHVNMDMYVNVNTYYTYIHMYNNTICIYIYK